MPYDLLVCDLDGTLVESGGGLDPTLAAALRGAASRGLLISIATGRMPPGVDQYRDALGLTAPLIFYNGALIRDHRAGRDLLALTLPRGLLWTAYSVFARAPVHPLFYRDDQLYCLERSMPVRTYSDEQGVKAHVIPAPDDFLRMGGFVKSLFIGHPDLLPILRGELEGAVGGGARLVMTRRDYLEMVPAGASKGMALRQLAEHLGVPLPRVIAVGDQENDLEMIAAAGLGVAMSHAPESVRSAADRIAPPAGEGGLLALFRALMPGRFP